MPSNDVGEFRFAELDPGRYLLAAERRDASIAGEAGPKGRLPEAYVLATTLEPAMRLDPPMLCISIVQEVFGFVKRNLSGAKRKKDTASGESGAGKGAATFFSAQYWREPQRDQRSDSQFGLMNSTPFIGCYRI